MSRIPSHLRGIKIKDLREMQKRGMSKEKQLYSDVLGTRLLASATRPALKRYYSLSCVLAETYSAESLKKTMFLKQMDRQVPSRLW